MHLCAQVYVSGGIASLQLNILMVMILATLPYHKAVKHSVIFGGTHISSVLGKIITRAHQISAQ